MSDITQICVISDFSDAKLVFGWLVIADPAIRSSVRQIVVRLVGAIGP
jgi:hypothetical protein